MAAHGTRATWCIPLTDEINRLLAAGTPPTLGDLVRRLETIAIDRAYVDKHLGELVQDPDLSRYIL